MSAVLRLLRTSRGATIVEYAIVLGLIASICIGMISGVGSSVNHAFKTVASCMSGNGNGNGNGGCGNNGKGGGQGGGKP